MELRTIELGRTIWLCHVDDFNPMSVNTFQVLSTLKENYNFKEGPTSLNEFDLSKGITLRGGEFLNSDGFTVNIHLTFHEDWLLADTPSSTKYAEEFLIEASNLLTKNLGLRKYEEVVRGRAYFSQIVVSSDISLDLINPKLNKISKTLSEIVGGGVYDFHVGGISFWPDQTGKYNPVPFVLERQSNVPFAEHRYFSKAALSTDDHFALLKELESALK